MAQYLRIHPRDPEVRHVRRTVEALRAGALIVYPTDSCYAFGCAIEARDAVERIRTIRGLTERHHLTLVCRDLAEIAVYARMDNWQFRLMKQVLPGSYVFILPATRELPKRLQHARRRTIGVRVPDHRVVAALLAELGAPLLSSTLLLPDDDYPMNDGEDIRERLERRVDLILDGGACGLEPTTVVDLTGEGPVVTRKGRGPIEGMGWGDGS